MKPGRKGGLARSKALSPSKRSAIAKKAAEARWKSKKPEIDPIWVKDFCGRHRINRFAIFGSILTNEFKSTSDVDVLVDFDKGVSLFDVVDAREELVKHWKRSVDLVSRRAVEQDHYAPRRDSIISGAKDIYVRQ